jgi:hypothetical protein
MRNLLIIGTLIIMRTLIIMKILITIMRTLIINYYRHWDNFPPEGEKTSVFPAPRGLSQSQGLSATKKIPQSR